MTDTAGRHGSEWSQGPSEPYVYGAHTTPHEVTLQRRRTGDDAKKERTNSSEPIGTALELEPNAPLTTARNHLRNRAQKMHHDRH